MSEDQTNPTVASAPSSEPAVERSSLERSRDEPTTVPAPVRRRHARSSPLGRQPLLYGCVGLLVLGSVFLFGLGLGFGAARISDSGATASTLAVPAAAGFGNHAGAASEQLEDDFGVFWEAMNLLYRDFYGELPSDEDATYGAIRGVINQLDDPNTSFMAPEDAEFFRSSIQGSFEGIGARVDWDEERDAVRIVEPFEGQPAWNAGVRRDDLVTAVDGESLAGSDLRDAVMKIRGPKGSVVTLTIVREGAAEPFDIEVTRDTIELPTIATDSLGEGKEIAYVRLSTFNENAGEDVRNAVKEAMENDPVGIIFDLRGNTGGLLREAVKVTSVFMDDEDVLIERFADGETQTYATEGRALVNEIPIVVLVNGGSASASEIVAGALQDAGRATLIGTTTFGKGSVQLPHTLSNGGIMRVTIARWFTPEDRSIDGTGLEPDVEIEITDEEFEADIDPQLDAAIKHLMNPGRKNQTDK